MFETIIKGKNNEKTMKKISKKLAKETGEKLGIKWDKYDVEQFRVGMEIELEHGKVDPKTNVTNDNPLKTGKIALAHLNEYSDYYTRLVKMEKQAKKYWSKKRK